MISFVLNFTVILFLSAQQNEVSQVAVGQGEEIYSEVLKQSIILFFIENFIALRHVYLRSSRKLS